MTLPPFMIIKSRTDSKLNSFGKAAMLVAVRAGTPVEAAITTNESRFKHKRERHGNRTTSYSRQRTAKVVKNYPTFF